MKYLKLTCLLLLALSSHAQTDSIVRYWKCRKNGTTPNVETWDINQAVTRAVYFQQGGLWKMESRFIATGRLYMTTSYSDSKWSKREGSWIAYHSNGKISISSFFKNNKENGLYRQWYENGRLSDSFFVINNLKTGKGFSWDSLGNIIAVYDLDEKGSGNVRYLNADQSPKAIGNWLANKRNGNWIYYGEGGFKEWEVAFSKDSILSSSCFTVDGKPKQECIFEREAMPARGLREWGSWLAKEINKEGYPSRKSSRRHKASELSGEVRVQFIVDQDGNIVDAEIVKSLNEEADNIALNVILKAPKWIPAIQKNKYVKSYRTQPITFFVTEEK